MNQSTILIVDDNASAREVLKGLLLGQDYNLFFAVGGEEALVKASELTPDLILLDVMMPGMDGFEVCRQLRADPVLDQVPVIMVTALDDQESILQGIEAGADDFITKPVNHAELKARVRTITRLNRYRRLVAERNKFDWVVKNANDGHALLDEEGIIQYANSQARLYLGLPADTDEPPSISFLDIAGQQYRFNPENAWENWPAPSPDQSPRYLVRPESATADTFWLQIETLALPAGAKENWMVSLRDVTEQMAVWREMWEFENLVSHKLRTPLGGVTTGLELLQDDYQITQLLDADTLSLFQMVFESAQRLKKDVLDILNYVSTSRLYRPGDGFNCAELLPLIRKICLALDLTTVTVTETEEGRGQKILLPEQAIELILQEILNNSKKFHPQHDPAIEILVSSADRESINLEIGDNGVSLSPAQLQHVWTPYYQGDKHFTGEMAGMGLGLPKVASLVWSVGGTCRLNNRPDGPGVVVQLALPVKNEKS